jgi:nicotinamidase/pyrazinamidase
VDENGRTLDQLLKSRSVKRVYVVGLATDYCVKATALDALELGYEVFAVTDAMRAVNVNPDDGAKALDEMERRGAHLITSDEILERGDPASAGAR